MTHCCEQMKRRVYKILSQAAWQSMQADGVLRLAGVDAEDGFVHLSASDQVGETLAKHFSGQTDLLLIGFEAEALGDALRWEVSRGGALFPHFYGPLEAALVTQVLALENRNGDTYLPDDWQNEEAS